jgi:hypothetical protein
MLSKMRQPPDEGRSSSGFRPPTIASRRAISQENGSRLCVRGLRLPPRTSSGSKAPKEKVFQRAIPLRLPVVQVRSGDGLDGRRRIGLNPAEGDAGTAEAPREPRQASLSTQPDEGRDAALGECVATAER